MSDIAEMILEGFLCDKCGGVVDGKETGYSRPCYDCKPKKKKKEKGGGEIVSEYKSGCGWIVNGIFCKQDHLCEHCQEKYTLEKERDVLKLRNSYLEQLEKSITEDVKKAAQIKFEEEKGQAVANGWSILGKENAELKANWEDAKKWLEDKANWEESQVGEDAFFKVDDMQKIMKDIEGGKS
jgi:hypothetical protein